MTAKRLLKRILAVMAGVFTFVVFLAVVQSNATPIRPDLKQVLSQPPEDSSHLPMARAGWDGAEAQRSARDARNATLERLGPAASARVVRASLVSAAIPDYRAVAGILLVILLLRRIRETQEKQRRLATVVPFPQAAEEEREQGIA